MDNVLNNKHIERKSLLKNIYRTSFCRLSVFKEIRLVKTDHLLTPDGLSSWDQNSKIFYIFNLKPYDQSAPAMPCEGICEPLQVRFEANYRGL